MSDFHSPIIIKDIVQWNIKINRVRQRDSVGAPVSLQQKDYSKRFHIIDKRNGAETKCNIDENRYIYDWIELNHYTTSSSHLYKVPFVSFTFFFFSNNSCGWTLFSKSHDWAPKLTFRYFNTNLNNVYKI